MISGYKIDALNKKKILVLGSTGQLGHQVVWRLEKNNSYEVSNLAYRTKLTDSTIFHDVTDLQGLKKIITEIKPDVVINCIGVLVSDSNASPKRAILLNALMPHELAELCTSIQAKLIHISTDCVFSGARGNYTIADIKDGTDVYAKTKSLGEIEGHPVHCTLRTSIVGPELKENGTGLFHWFMGQPKVVTGYTKAIWSGVTTLQLAKIIEEAIEKRIAGLYQITNGTPINKYELLKLFAANDQKNVTVNAIEGKAVDKSMLQSEGQWNTEIPSYEVMVKEMTAAIRANIDRYPVRYQSIVS